MNARSLLTSWLRDRSRSRTPIRNRPMTGRLGVEPLEDRLVPTNTPATLLTGLRNTLDGVVDNLVSQAIQSAEATLPVINTKLRDLQTGVENAIDGVTNGINRILTGQDPGAVQTRQNLTATLNPAVPDQAARDQAAAAVASALAPYAQNVRVLDLRPADGVAVVEMDLVVPLAARSFALGTALPALPVQLGEAAITLESDLRYEGLRVELQNDQFVFQANSGRTNELQLTLDAGLTKGAQFAGEIGFLRGTARVNDAGVGLHGKLVADVGQGLQVSIPRFEGLTAVADLQLTAEFATAGADSGIAMPKFRTDFRLDWDLSGARPNDPAASLGGTPRVAFKKVSVGLGSLLSQSIGPVVKTIQQLSAPIQPVLDLLAAPIPGLSDVGIGEVNLLKLAKLAQSAGTLPPHLQLLTKIALEVATLHTIVSRIDIPGGEVFINLGDYNLTGSDGGTDLRRVKEAEKLSKLATNLSLQNLTDLKGLLVSGAKTLSQRIDEIKGELPPAVQGLVSDWLVQTGAMNQLLGVGNGVKLTFPFIEDPVGGAVKILLGQAEGVKFVEFTADLIQVVPETELLKFPVWGPVQGNATGSIDIELHFGLRYDAVGLRDFLAKQFHPNANKRGTDPMLFARGLAFDSRNPNSLRHPNDLIHVTANIGAGAHLPVPVGAVVPGPFGFPVTAEVRVGPRGSLNGNLAVRLADPEGNGVIRPLYAPAGSRPQYLFEAEGKLAANIKLLVEAWFSGIKLFNLYERPLLDKTLFDTKDVDRSNPFRPPAQPGTFSDFERFHRGFDVRSNGGRNSGPANDILVRMNGDRIEVHVNRELKQTYDRLTTLSLTLVGTRHNDNFVVRAIPVDVTVRGAFQMDITQGYDTLTLDDRVPWLSPDMTYNVSADRVTTLFRSGQFLFNTDFRHTAIDDIRLIVPSRANVVNVDALPAVPFTIQTTPQYLPFVPSMFPRPTYDPALDSRFPPANFITVNSSALNRDGASLTIDGRSGADFVTVRENLFTTYTYYTVGTDRVVREGSDGDFQPYRTGTVRFTGVDKLAVVDEWGGNLGRFYRVVGLDPATPVSITGGGGGDEFRLGGSLDALSGTDPFRVPYLTLAGGGGHDWLSLDDSLNTDAATVGEAGAAVPTRVTSPWWWVNGPRIERTNTVQDLQLGTSTTYRLAVEATGFESVSIAGSSGDDEFTVEATPAGQELSVSGGAGDDALAFGTFWVDGLHGPVTFAGGAGTDRLTVGDIFGTAPGSGNVYEVRADRVTARGRTVGYSGVEEVALSTGPGFDWVNVEGTPDGTGLEVETGGGDDFVTVRASGGPLSVDLGDGNYQTVALGSAAHPLDAIHKDVRVAGAGFVDVFVSDAASTTSHYVNVDSNFFSGQTLDRYHFVGEQWVTTHRFLFSFDGQSRLNHWTGRAGDTVIVSAVPANSSVAVYGQPWVNEAFGVGFGADANRILGSVSITAQAADNDFAYYYDYLNPGPQTYDIQSADDQALVVRRSGAAPVTYHDLGQVIFYSPVVGGSTVNVQGLPARTYLNMAVGNGDRVTFGSNAPGLGGTLDGIRGPVSVGPGGVGAAATLVLDDSGNAATGRDVTVTSSEYQGIPLGTIEGLTPRAIVFRDQDNWVVDVRGGARDDRFRMSGKPLAARASIDGGGGVNTLDYSGHTPTPRGLVSWYQAEGSGSDAIGGLHGSARNGAAFAPGRAGQAFDLDGVDDFVEIADSLRHTPASITVEAWVKPDTVIGGHVIASKYQSHEPDNKSWAMLNIDGRVRFGVYQGAAARAVDTDAPVLTPGVWQHVAATFDVVTGEIRIYVDGILAPSSFVPGGHNATITAITDGNGPVRIGSIVNVNGTMTNFWDGLIDEVGLFDRALSAAEVRALHTAGKPALAQGIAVNLRTGTATGLRGGITNIHNVVGSAGDDLLVGNGGNILDGRAGRDILIAGPAGAVPGLVARYTAADGDATDSVGDHDGTVHGGVTFGPGYRGQGFEFNGVDAYVQVPNAPDLEPTTVTVEAWVRATAPGRSAYIVSKGALGGIAASYALYTGTNGGLQFYIGGGGSFALSPDAGTAVWDGEWHHVAGTFDGAVVRLFVDGVEVGTGTPTTLRIGYDLPDSNDLFLGSYNRGYLFNGAIDEVAIHGRALSAAEVVISFYSRLAGSPSGMLIGGDGDDLLIAGSTAFDLDPVALAQIQAEWTRTDIDYEARVANLTTGNGEQVPRLSSETVSSNGGGNILSGGPGPDLFFASVDLDLTDDEDGESVVVILRPPPMPRGGHTPGVSLRVRKYPVRTSTRLAWRPVGPTDRPPHPRSTLGSRRRGRSPSAGGSGPMS